MEAIDNAVRNILRLKFRLGLFENPYVDETLARKVAYAPEHLVSSQAVRRGVYHPHPEQQ